MLATPAPIFSTHPRNSPLRPSNTFCPGAGVTNHTAPWKRSGSEASTPACSFPAMGCPARNRRPACLPKVAAARARISDFVLPTSVSSVLAGREGPRRPINSMIAPTGAASRTTWLSRDAFTGSVSALSIAPLPRARFKTGARSQPTIRPLKPRFFKASPKEPPIRPVPMMVIWRIAMWINRREGQGRRGKEVQLGALCVLRW